MARPTAGHAPSPLQRGCYMLFPTKRNQGLGVMTDSRSGSENAQDEPRISHPHQEAKCYQGLLE